jgi:hypothetical protein
MTADACDRSTAIRALLADGLALREAFPALVSPVAGRARGELVREQFISTARLADAVGRVAGEAIAGGVAQSVARAAVLLSLLVDGVTAARLMSADGRVGEALKRTDA